jgi:hypothetical protein
MASEDYDKAIKFIDKSIKMFKTEEAEALRQVAFQRKMEPKSNQAPNRNSSTKPSESRP